MERLLLLLLLAALPPARAGPRDEVKARAGAAAALRCAVNRQRCGDFHSIKWYKENRRVFVYSPVVDFSKAEGELLGRGSLQLDTQEARLSISPVRTTDEGEYKCEITFLDISKNCPVVQLVKLTTLAEPRYANISLTSGKGSLALPRQIVSNSVVGPFNEGTELVLTCESGGGKPIPRVGWWRGGRAVPGRASSSEEADRTGTGRSELTLTVDRGLLGARLECKAENEAVSQPLTASVQLDVSLRPETVRIAGAERPVRAGAVVSLECAAAAARPAAVLTWYNGSQLFPDQPAGQVELESAGTYTTTSRLSFIASRFEDNRKIFCEATNEVLQFYGEEAVRADSRLEVLYPPVVTIHPINITVNTTDEVIIHCSHQSNPSRLLSVKWYHDGQLVDVGDPRFAGGSPRQPALRIRAAGRGDRGRYSCVLETALGPGTAPAPATLDVHYPPVVRLRMEPGPVVSETDQTNVTLHCELQEGNPPRLQSVRWYMDTELLKQLPQCDGTNPELCDIEPSHLLLEHVSRHFHGNFSCVGSNAAGPSAPSPRSELRVLYPPGNATLVADRPGPVVKGSSLTLQCEVADPGRPAATSYLWRRGGRAVPGVTGPAWTISPVRLESQAAVSCQAVNRVGRGNPASATIQVAAPPSFIESLHPYTGFTASSANVSLLCQVECSPLCDILWLKDGVPITDNSDYFTIRTRQVPPNYSKNDFESVKSMLVWNLENWPQGRLNRKEDNTNYSCKSSSNGVGQGVSSATHFRVEYPPDNLFISQEVVNVVENKVPEKVLCKAEAYPEASFMWRFDDEVIQTHNLLNFASAVSRAQDGVYVCEAHNRHGTSYATTRINVMYRPECSIHQEKFEDKILLTCESDANPDEVSFLWKKGNESYEGEVATAGLASSIQLGLMQQSFGTYYCFVNNSIGQSIPCEIDIQGIGVLKSISDTNIIVIVAVLAAGLLVTAILVVLVVFCRRRAAGEKSGGGEGGVKEGEAGSGGQQQQPQHKWPLRPGVHVHVNGLNTLTGSDNKINHQISGFSYGAKTSRSSSSSGSDWASNNSNTSSNPELSDSDPKRLPGRQTVSSINGSGGHQELTTATSYGANDLSGNGSRPNSRQRKKRDVNKNLANNGQSDQLLPTFYENVSSIQSRQAALEERLRESRSQSPAGVSRPASQLSAAHTLHAFGSARSSRASKHSASPRPDPAALQHNCMKHALLASSTAARHCRLDRGGGLNLAEAELESNPDTGEVGGRGEQDVMIEYSSAHPPQQYIQPQYSQSHEAPIFSSLKNFQSLPRGGGGEVGLPRHLPAVPAHHYSRGSLLAEPIQPPKQFDSMRPGREETY